MEGDVKREVRKVLEIRNIEYYNSHINDIIKKANITLFNSQLCNAFNPILY